jgi:hypothetical protein
MGRLLLIQQRFLILRVMVKGEILALRQDPVTVTQVAVVALSVVALATKAHMAAVVVLAEQVLVVHQFLAVRVATLLVPVFNPVVAAAAAHQQIQTPLMVARVE